MRWFKKTKPQLRRSYHVYVRDAKHKYENHPKEGEFTLVLIAMSLPIAKLFIETELDQQGYNWFYNEFQDTYMLIKERKDVGRIRTIVSGV